MSTTANREHKKYAALHTWIGLFFGSLLFIEIFAGAVVVFWKEIQVWQQSEQIHRHTDLVSMQEITSAVRAVSDEFEAPLEGLQVVLPGPNRPLLKLGVLSADENLPPDERFEERYYDLSGVPKQVYPPRGVAEILFDLHAHLLIPWKISHVILGMLGMLMLVLLVSGVLIHKKIITNAFNFRTSRSMRLQWTDLHNRIGIWGLPFHLMIAITAVPYALHETPWLLGMSIGATGGSLAPQKMVELFGKDWPEPRGEKAAIANLGSILSDAKRRKPDVHWDVMRLVHPGDIESRITLLGFANSAASLSPTLVYDGSSGEFLGEEPDPIGQGSLLGGKVFTMMVHLHRGDFAGFSSKLIWFFLGLAGALLSVSGQMIWLERKSHKVDDKKALRRLELMSNITFGSTAGFVVAVAAALVAQQVSHLLDRPAETLVLCSLFGSWIAFAIWAIKGRNGFFMTRQALFLLASLGLAAVLVRWFHLGFAPVADLRGLSAVPIAVDCGILVMSFFTAWMAKQLPEKRRNTPGEKRRTEMNKRYEMTG